MTAASPVRIALAGAGAFGEKHLDGLKLIGGVEIVSIISRTSEQAAEVARKYGAKHSSTELEDALGVRAAFVTRFGNGVLPTPDTVVQEGDAVYAAE